MIFLSLPLALAFVTVLSGQVTGSELKAVPGLQGLEFSTVEIATMIAVQISDGVQNTNRLYARMFDRFKQHKLIPRPGLDDASYTWEAPCSPRDADSKDDCRLSRETVVRKKSGVD